jgi:hypothetical protein
MEGRVDDVSRSRVHRAQLNLAGENARFWVAAERYRLAQAGDHVRAYATFDAHSLHTGACGTQNTCWRCRQEVRCVW